MKRRLLFTGLFLSMMLISGFSFAQCTPDPLTDPEGNGEMSPDTLECTEQAPYSQVLSIIAPDTASVAPGITLTLHHITLKSITNKPAWLSYACNPGTCEYNAGVLQCALVSGTPPAGSADTIYMDVLVDVYAIILGNPTLVAADYNSGNQLVLIIHGPAGVEEIDNNGFGIIQNQPNPFKSETKIGCYTKNHGVSNLQVVDLLGNVVYTEQIITNPGENYFTFNGSFLSNGVYFYSVSDENKNIVTRKMVKAN